MPLMILIFSLFIQLLLVMTTLAINIDMFPWTLNATGASFPQNVYTESAFAYKFVQPTQTFTYYSLGSTAGKCNIMGYWHTGNSQATWISSSVKALDTLKCTDACTVATCGFAGSANALRPDRLSRQPLNDIGASDALLKTADYNSFPDLQLLPALGGAVVPIYNIPDLPTNGTKLILSRSTVTNIFLGNIRYWNDSRILNDNPEIAFILSTITSIIHCVVRNDGSGTTNIFTDGLSAFDPIRANTNYDYSFAATVTSSEKPTWCGPFTDEIQFITINNCDSTKLANINKAINMLIVGSDYILRPLSFPCDIDATSLASLIQSANGNKPVYISKTIVNSISSIFKYGYLSSADTTKYKPQNWYHPILLSSSSAVANGVKVSFSTLQEGGYVNSHYSSKQVIPEIKSLWIYNNTNNEFFFNITYGNIWVGTFSSVSLNSNQLYSGFNGSVSGLINSVTAFSRVATGWNEYRIVFNNKPTSWKADQILIKLFNHSNEVNIGVTTYQTANNFPLFYNTTNRYGFSNSGMYSCYKRNHNYQEFIYNTGNLNPGVIAGVLSIPYSLGYSVLDDAIIYKLSTANMINKAGTIVSATSNSVAYAVLELGGNLDSKLTANIIDGSTINVWPFAGFTYFIIRKRHHIGTCQQRQAAIEYLYNYYYSSTVQRIASNRGFAVLPSFIRSIVVNHMLDNVYCNDNKTYALAKYRQQSNVMLSTSMMATILNTYFTVYANVDSSSSFTLTSHADSNSIWNKFSSQPNAFAGAFTVFGCSAATKLAKYQSTTASSVVTSAFTSFAIVNVYHLNSFNSAPGNPILQLTSDILTGIYTGTILYWNDSQIQTANINYKQYLPFKRILIITQSNPSETNVIFSRFMSMKSTSFRNLYNIANDGNSMISFQDKFPNKKQLISVSSDTSVDAAVTHYDGAIGYYSLLNGLPNSFVSSYCNDINCKNVIYPLDNGKSLEQCQQDPNIMITNVQQTVSTYDLLLSTSSLCYPIAGTVDYSTAATNGDNSIHQTISKQRVKFTAWLYNGTTVTSPLTANYQAIGSSTSIRNSFYTTICNINNYGYQYCGYRDCSYANGDYIQSVTQCDEKTATRTVTYILTASDCLENNPSLMPKSPITIPCSYLPMQSSLGFAAVCLLAIGAAITVIILAIILKNYKSKIIKRSQPIFVIIFLIGSLMMNMIILAYLGKNDSSTCLLRPWLFNIASTIMFAPLISKLRRVDIIMNNPTLRRVKISDSTVLGQVGMFLLIDFILLILWTVIERPRVINSSNSTYINVLQPIEEQICSTGLSNVFEIICIVYKGIILAIGVRMAISTWNVTSDLAEAKHFAIAIYNIATIGGLAYFLGIFLASSNGVGAAILLRSLGLFFCSTIAVVVIMVPKVLAIEGMYVSPDAVGGTYDSQVSVIVNKKSSVVVQSPKHSKKSDRNSQVERNSNVINSESHLNGNVNVISNI